MASAIYISVFVVLIACLSLRANAAHVKAEVPAEKECSYHVCNADKTKCWGKLCALSTCIEGKQIGYVETDYSKPYPQCCPHPVCAD